MSTGMLRSGYLLSIVECQIKETSEHARSRGTARLLRSLRGEFSRGRWFEEQNEVPPCLVTKDERRNKEERNWIRWLLATWEQLDDPVMVEYACSYLVRRGEARMDLRMKPWNQYHNGQHEKLHFCHRKTFIFCRRGYKTLLKRKTWYAKSNKYP